MDDVVTTGEDDLSYGHTEYVHIQIKSATIWKYSLASLTVGEHGGLVA